VHRDDHILQRVGAEECEGSLNDRLVLFHCAGEPIVRSEFRKIWTLENECEVRILLEHKDPAGIGAKRQPRATVRTGVYNGDGTPRADDFAGECKSSFDGGSPLVVLDWRSQMHRRAQG
jgi:hypothetical protein